MASLPKDLHFVLFPLMTQGHMIPMFDIARLLAERGPTVTIITTPVNAKRFKPVIARAIQENLKIQVLELELALSEVGLPEGCENFDLIPSAELFPKLFTAALMLAEPAENMFRGLTPAPSCIISDNLLAWTSDIAQKFNIPRIIFHGPGCFTFLCLHIAIYTNVLDDIAVSDSEYFVLPGLPDRVELTREQILILAGSLIRTPPPKAQNALASALYGKIVESLGDKFSLSARQRAVLECLQAPHAQYFLTVIPFEGLGQQMSALVNRFFCLLKIQVCSWGGKTLKEAADFVEYVRKAEHHANGIVVNSFYELEPKYVEELAKTKDKKVWCIGPVSLCNKSFQDIAERGSKGAIDEQDCLKWLDSKEPESVIFVSLGSLVRVCTEQNIDLALGLESSNKPFLWCIRHTTEELERWFLDEGYEERMKDRRLIIRGWAPQVLVLSHQAVGGFVTHCGWNSTLEAVSTGVPMVTWPQFSDQFINERFIVDVVKVGVKIGMEAPVAVGEEDKFGVVVKKEDVKRSVEDVMDKGEEGEARRKRCRELAKMAKEAMEDGGSSCLSMTSMIQDIIELCL